VAYMGLLSKWVESLDYEYEIRSSCTRHKSRHSVCTKCVDVCEQDAIMNVNGKPVLNDRKCVQCGDCMAACPVQAIAGILPERKIIKDQLILSDHHFPTEKELLIFAKKGITSIICEDESFIHEWKPRIEQVNLMLEELGQSPLSISNTYVEEEDICSRREFFSVWKKESKSWMKQMTPAKWRFNQNALNLRLHYPGYQFTKLTIDVEKCTLCNVCQRVCDKKCFHIGDEQFSLSLQYCSLCQLCADICPEKAIVFEEKIIKVEETQLPVYEINCKVCHGSFKTLREQDETCTACSKLNTLS
jgi:ferredoxin